MYILNINIVTMENLQLDNPELNKEDDGNSQTFDFSKSKAILE